MAESSARRPIQPDELAALILGLATFIGCAIVIGTSPAAVAWWVHVIWIITLATAINLGVSFESGDANFGSIIIAASFLALGLGPAALITMIGVLLGEGLRHLIPETLSFTPRGQRHALVTAGSNLSLHGLSLLVGGMLYRFSGGRIPIVEPGQSQWIMVDFAAQLVPLLGLFGGYLLTNYSIFALYHRLEGNRVRDYIRRHWRTVTRLEVLPIFFAILIASAYLNTPTLVFASFCVLMIVVMGLIHNLSRARARLEQRVRELNSLSILGQAVANSLELPEVLEAVYQQTRQLMDAAYFYVALYNGGDSQLVFPLAYEDGVRTRYNSRAFGPGLTEHVIATRRPLLIQHNVRAVLEQLGIQPGGPLAQAWLGVPIVFGDDVLGAIGVQNMEHPDRYTAAHRDILVAIAAQAAAAIHNAQTYITARHHTTNLAILNSVSMALNSTLDLSRVLDIIVTSVGRVMGNQKAAIFLTDEAGQTVSLAASHNLSPQYIALSKALPVDPDGRTLVVITRQPLIVDDVRTDPRLSGFRATADTEGFRAFADMPLQTHAQAIGGLTIYYADAHHFTLAEIDLLNTFANQAAIAVVNAKRYSRADEALTRRIEQLAALEQLGRDLSASLDFDQVIQRVLQRAMQATGASYGLIGLWRPDRQVTRVTVTLGYSAERANAILGADWPVTRGLVGRAIRSGQLQRVSNVHLDPDYVSVEAAVQSELVVPIQQDDRILGIINLEGTQVDQFDQSAADFVGQLATQAAIALHNAQLYRNAQTRLGEMESLYTIGQQLTSILDLQQLGRELTRQIARALDSTFCALTLLRPATGLMEIIGQYPNREVAPSSAPDLPATYRLADFLATQARLERREPLIVYRADPGADPIQLNLLREHELHALLTVPLIAINEVIGAVVWADSRPDRSFSPDELRLAQTLANQAAIAVQNARLFDDRARRINELSQLYQASLALTASVDLHEVLRRISITARTITDADSVTVYLYDAEQDTFERAYHLGASADWSSAPQIRRTGLTRRVIDESLPILLDDTVTEPDLNPILRAAGVRSLIAAPLVSRGHPLGVLYVNSFTPHHFDADGQQVITALANQAAIAIDNARLFAATANGRDQVQAILNSAHDGILMFDPASHILLVNPELEQMWGLPRADLEGHTLQDLLDHANVQLAAKLGLSPAAVWTTLQQLQTGQQIDWPKETFALPRLASNESTHAERYVERACLPVRDARQQPIGWMLVLRDVTEERELQQLRDELTNTIVHDLRSPLTSILGGLYMLKDMVKPDQPDSDESQALTISIRSTNKLLNLVNSLLDISKLTSGQALVDVRPMSLGTLVQTAVAHLIPLAQEAEIIIRQQVAHDLPRVLGDEDKLGRVLTNLLDNALKFTPASGQINVLAERWAVNPAFVRCAVRDTGPGIPAEFRTRIFERFVQLPEQVSRRRGTGLGLSFCRLALEAHGGQIWVDDAPGGGSEFSFTLKVAEE
ncbi:MAG: GAF domain-containing protein [Chloroflexi bacterium]|nr:GAF domain-containing protein [Chloroflexota bacterium]